MDWSEISALLQRESSTVEWKKNVARGEDVARTLTAFANDIEQRGGGHVICGVEETSDASGAKVANPVGLEPSRIRELIGEVGTMLRRQARPAIVARAEVIDIPGHDGRQVLVFHVDPSPHAVSFTHRREGTHHFIRVADATERAEGRLEELLRLKRALPGQRIAARARARGGDDPRRSRLRRLRGGS